MGACWYAPPVGGRYETRIEEPHPPPELGLTTILTTISAARDGMGRYGKGRRNEETRVTPRAAALSGTPR
jgi:hypothetical protein